MYRDTLKSCTVSFPEATSTRNRYSCSDLFVFRSDTGSFCSNVPVGTAHGLLGLESGDVRCNEHCQWLGCHGQNCELRIVLPQLYAFPQKVCHHLHAEVSTGESPYASNRPAKLFIQLSQTSLGRRLSERAELGYRASINSRNSRELAYGRTSQKETRRFQPQLQPLQETSVNSTSGTENHVIRSP